VLPLLLPLIWIPLVSVMIFNPIVSVLLATYNTDFNLIKRAIDSVLQQDFQNFELLVMDDGSEPTYSKPLHQYALQFPTKVKYLFHPNCGQSQTINRAIANSKGTYITIIDADDEFKPTHLSSCLTYMTTSDLISSTTETVVTDPADFYVPDKLDHSKVIHVDDCILFATLFGRREVFTGILFSDMYAADSHFYEQASVTFSTQKVDLRTYIYYRNNPNSICAKLKSKARLLSAG